MRALRIDTRFYSKSLNCSSVESVPNLVKQPESMPEGLVETTLLEQLLNSGKSFVCS
jgi:hypothetical protein